MSGVSKSQAGDHIKRVQGVAMDTSIVWGISSFIAVSGLTYMATKRWVKFDKFLSISAKTSFPVMAGLLAFSWRYEYVASDAQFHPVKYGLPVIHDRDVFVKEYSKSKMPIHHR